jgi:hypothetical protein
MLNLVTAVVLLLIGVGSLYSVRSIIGTEPTDGSRIYWLYTRMPLMRTLHSFPRFVGGLSAALGGLGFMAILAGAVILVRTL